MQPIEPQQSGPRCYPRSTLPSLGERGHRAAILMQISSQWKDLSP